MSPEQIIQLMAFVKALDAWLAVGSNRTLTSIVVGLICSILALVWFGIFHKVHPELIVDWMVLVNIIAASLMFGAVCCFCADWVLDNTYFYTHALVVWYTTPLGPPLDILNRK